MRKNTFIHYSSNKKIHRGIPRTDDVMKIGIEYSQPLNKTKTKDYIYRAITFTEVKEYRTFNGADKFMRKKGFKPVAIEEHGIVVML